MRKQPKSLMVKLGLADVLHSFLGADDFSNNGDTAQRNSRETLFSCSSRRQRSETIALPLKQAQLS